MRFALVFLQKQEEAIMAYRGNNNLRSAKEDIELNDFQQSEYDKCKDSAEYFIRNYCYIDTKSNGKQLFDLRPRQAQLLQELDNNRFIKGDWYRQSGFTTTCLAYLMWKMIFSGKPLIILYMNSTDNYCKGEFSKFREMYINLPYWMQPGVRAWSNTNVELRNRSCIMAMPVTGSNGRGLTPNYIMFDDFGFLTDRCAMQCAQSIIPTLMMTRSAHIITGHSHKFGNQTAFNLLYWKNNEKLFYVSENSWNTDTQHDAAWAEAERVKIGYDRFEREYVGTIFQDAMDSSKKDEPEPLPFWTGAIDRIPDLIRRNRWTMKFHSHRKDWETLNEHMSVCYVSHGEVEYYGKKYPALKIGIGNDEGSVASAMDLEGYVTADLCIFDWKVGTQVAGTRYECVCLNSLITPEMLTYEDVKPEYWRTELTLIIMDRCAIMDGKGRLPEIVDETVDNILLECLGAAHGWREKISIFLDDNCHA